MPSSPAAMQEPRMFPAKRAETEAIRYWPTRNCEAVHDWLGLDHSDDDCHDGAELLLTWGGWANPGDWIVRKPDGEFTAMTHEHFTAMYEVDDA